MKIKKMMVTLVHGTWAKNASWTQSGSSLRTGLEDAGYRVETTNWGAGNSFSQRRDGALLLRRHLLEYPEYENVVIAHSHFQFRIEISTANDNERTDPTI